MSDFLMGMNLIKELGLKIDPNLKEYVDASLDILHEMTMNILKP
jgi:hypothetical protein